MHTKKIPCTKHNGKGKANQFIPKLNEKDDSFLNAHWEIRDGSKNRQSKNNEAWTMRCAL